MSVEIELHDFYGRRTSFRELGIKLKRVLVTEAKDDIYDVLVTGGQNIRNRITRSMRDSPKTGKLYFIKGKKHQASSKGNYPRPMNSDLLRSIKMDERVVRGEVEVGSMITKKSYPMFLEKGTARMAARPWLERSFKAYEPDIKRNLMRALRDAAGRLGAA